LILDLLVARAIPLSARAITQAAALFGIGENAVRVCLSRLISAGKVDRPGRGLYLARLQPSHLAHIVDNWHRREQLRRPWHGQWLALQDASASKADKSLWRRHQRALGLRGFASLGPQLHIRPDNLRITFTEFQVELESLGIASGSCLMQIHQIDKLHEAQARKLWNTQALEAAHKHWISVILSSHQRLDDMPLPSAVRESLLLGRSAIAHLLRDPLLPEELMPSHSRLSLEQELRSYQQHAIELWSAWLDQKGAQTLSRADIHNAIPQSSQN
jgi:phenylacetic acid degradation operon negative regulatory protein